MQECFGLEVYGMHMSIVRTQNENVSEGEGWAN